MPSIVSDRFRVKNSENFISSVSTENIYMFIGRISPWGDPALTPPRSPESDAVPPTPFNTVGELDYEAWFDLLGAKKVTQADTFHMIRRYDWSSGSIYDAYDPYDFDLYRKAFYVLTEDTVGNDIVYRVYKVLVSGGVSTIKPTGTQQAPISLSDGYVWKFMYELSTTQVLRQLTPQHVPVPNDKFPSNIGNEGLTPFPVSEDGTVGHGYDPIRELGAYYIGVNIRLEFDENGDFTTENDYRKIGLIKNPRLFGSTTIATGPTYRQTYKLTLTSAPDDAYVSDVEVTGNGFTANVVGQFTNPDTGEVSPDVFVQLTSGAFPTPPFTINDGVTETTVATVENPELNDETGDVLFIEYRKPIPRSDDQVESLTIVLEF